MKNKKGQITTVLVTVIVACVFLAIIWDLYQGSSGALLIKNEDTGILTNDTFYPLDHGVAVGTETVICNVTTLTRNTDYSFDAAQTSSNLKLYGNRTGGTSCDNKIFDYAGKTRITYSYYSKMYINNSLVRMILSFVAVAIAITILVMAFTSRKGEE